MMPDLEDRVAVANYVRKMWPMMRVINNGWVAWRLDRDPRPEVYEHMQHEGVRLIKRHGGVVRHPDIMVVDPHVKGGPKIRLVIEIDGAVHHSKQTRTQVRNLEYSNFGVPLLVLQGEHVTDSYDWRGRVREAME